MEFIRVLFRSRYRQTGKLRHRRRLQRGKGPPSKGTLIERNGSAVRLDRCLDGVLGNGHETGLPGIAEHKDVRGHAVAKKSFGKAGGSKDVPAFARALDEGIDHAPGRKRCVAVGHHVRRRRVVARSEEHTYELKCTLRSSYAVCS